MLIASILLPELLPDAGIAQSAVRTATSVYTGLQSFVSLQQRERLIESINSVLIGLAAGERRYHADGFSDC